MSEGNGWTLTEAGQGEEIPRFVVISVSTYPESLAKLDSLVDELKSRGNRHANRSMLIRAAIDQVDLSKVK